MSGPTLSEIAKALGGEVRNGRALAPGPGHSAADRSLSVSISDDEHDGFIVHSFSDDDVKECRDYVREKVGLSPFKPNGHAKEPRARKVVASRFDYEDETGAILYQVERKEFQNHDGSFVQDGKKRKKTFSQRRPDGNGGWISGPGCLDGVRRIPYRLPELIEAVGTGAMVVIAEGERCIDLLRGSNVPATCNSGGAKNWRPCHSAYLSGADVVVLPDNDMTGRAHLDQMAASLVEAGATVRVLDLPGLPPKGDVVDWAANGGTAGDLHSLIASNATPWLPGEPVKALPASRIVAKPYIYRDPKKIPRANGFTRATTYEDSFQRRSPPEAGLRQVSRGRRHGNRGRPS
jgi:hypothetical protein